VFFDAVGLPYEYEKEGFVLNDGTNYLPDFWLPSLKLWVEIKSVLEHEERIIPAGGGFSESDQETMFYTCPVLDQMRRFRNSQPWPVACIVGRPRRSKDMVFRVRHV